MDLERVSGLCLRDETVDAPSVGFNTSLENSFCYPGKILSLHPRH